MINYYCKKTYPSNVESLLNIFYAEMVAAGGNKILYMVHEAIQTLLRPRASTLVHTREQVQREILRLERIADGIENGDLNMVASCLVLSLEERRRQCLAGASRNPAPAPVPPAGPEGGQRRMTKGEAIAQDLEEKILGGEYKAGGLLPAQDELCALYGASPRSVRDALGRLQARALVDVGQGRRTRVRSSRLDHYIASLSASMRNSLKIDGKMVMDLIQLDLALVLSSIRTACAAQVLDKEALARLKGLTSRMRSLLPEIEKGDPQARERFFTIQGRFHRAVLGLGSHSFLETIQEKLASFLEMENVLEVTAYTPGELRSRIEDFCRLVEAIEARKSPLALSIAAVVISTAGSKLAAAYGLVWPTGAKASR